ncbi:MAG: helix-turn-helix domain-containing protein [Paenibacillus dendritiformis]|uniref:helix-turn-helix domain-containing protein n=1 Tax=uncultured Paenibacillus sp. TaxID=227322 RepID=UPI0025DB478C|nr:helix-turn-helix domain-containing protein [uncultured Paenibacillus sp.]MDU5141233.1 helix-turn-helix domain-containing protein [Paenibacillus dendritiformis]
METKNASATISEREFLTLLQAAKQKDTEAMLQIIEIFKEDILKISTYIKLPTEDVVSHIILELLEAIVEDEFSK